MESEEKIMLDITGTTKYILRFFLRHSFFCESGKMLTDFPQTIVTVIFNQNKSIQGILREGLSFKLSHVFHDLFFFFWNPGYYLSECSV